MKREDLAVGEYYHVFNRGAAKQIIFKDERDRIRFLFLILYFQSNTTFQQISRIVAKYTKERVQHPMLGSRERPRFNVEDNLVKEIVDNRNVELVSFALMPNHFHLIVKETEEGGIAKYMQRVLNSYTKYFNTRHKVSGHLFQGSYKHVRVEDNEQLLYLSAYVHLNPSELANWKNKEVNFFWSSYRDYVQSNRWGKLLLTEIISGQFKNKKEYSNFVKTSGAKENCCPTSDVGQL